MSEVSSHMASFGFVETASFVDLKCYSKFRDMDPFLQQVLLDVANVASFFNRGFKMEPHLLQETIVSLGYRLVRLQPLGSPLLRGKLESACHIAITALMTTLFIQIGRRRFLQYELVGQHLKGVVATGLDKEDPDVRLWLLFVGGISVVPECDESWLFENIQDAARAGGVQNWEDLRRRLMQLPWIMLLHDAEAERLWYSSLRMVY
jgi:hypothetical protein